MTSKAKVAHGSSSSPLVATALLIAALTVGCGGTEGADLRMGSVRLAVSAPVAGDQVAKATATISGDGATDLAPFAVDLTEDGTFWGAYLTGIPSGSLRLDVVAYDATGTPLYGGSAASEVSRGATAVVKMMLQPVAPAPVFENSPPVIDALWASAVSVPLNGTVSAGAAAHGVNPGTSLTYAWTTTCGTFADSSVPQVTWTAPGAAATCLISVTVDNGQGASVTAYVDIDVVP